MKNWNLADATVTHLVPVHMAEGQRPVWDLDGRYVLKGMLNARIIELAQLLASEDIPVAQYLPTVDGSFITTDGYALMTKITGEHIDLFHQPHLAKEFGRGLGRLHIALAKIEPQIEGCSDNNMLDSWYSYILPGLDDAVPAYLRDDVEAKLTEICPALPCQLIHRDVHCQNVLFDNGQLTAWLDFDLNHRNIRIFDIAYLLAGLIMGNQHNTEKAKIWRQVYCTLLSAYDEVNPLTADEHRAMPLMMIAIELLFVSFWNRNNNPEQSHGALELAIWLYTQFDI